MAFNNLTDSQAERLALLVEELGEAGQAAGKILRHGYYSFHPFRPELGSNKKQLERELGDILAAAELLINSYDLSKESIEIAKELKLFNVKQYLHHQ